jgi:hypothetical protein
MTSILHQREYHKIELTPKRPAPNTKLTVAASGICNLVFIWITWYLFYKNHLYFAKIILPPIGNKCRQFCTSLIQNLYYVFDSYFWSEGVAPLYWRNHWYSLEYQGIPLAPPCEIIWDSCLTARKFSLALSVDSANIVLTLSSLRFSSWSP